ncbi:MAG: hypothetical protein IPP72_14820 [Chitinophagaceae bacterium]|nr:hypothetical protein [Chitinophagaceae bacterium]
MKKIQAIFLFAATAVTTGSSAQFVVSLHSQGVAQHFSGVNALIDASNAALSGDTIYLPGGAFAAPANFDKGLTIFGAGHYEDSTQATGKSFITGNITLNENADHFHLEGVEITGNFFFSANAAVNQVTIKYCKLNEVFEIPGNASNPSTNIALIGNVFAGNVILTNARNTSVYNSILQSHITNSIGNQFYNSVFLFPGAGGDPLINGDMINNNLYNNIFLQTGWAIFSTVSGNTYKNNLFLLSAPNFGTASVSQNNYFGIAQAAIFINQTGNTFNYTHNYHLQSPLSYPGTDGSQAGQYGGIFPYKDGAVPSNPHIRIKNISATTDAQGKLNVNIHVAAQNN